MNTAETRNPEQRDYISFEFGLPSLVSFYLCLRLPKLEQNRDLPIRYVVGRTVPLQSFFRMPPKLQKA